MLCYHCMGFDFFFFFTQSFCAILVSVLFFFGWSGSFFLSTIGSVAVYKDIIATLKLQTMYHFVTYIIHTGILSWSKLWELHQYCNAFFVIVKMQHKHCESLWYWWGRPSRAVWQSNISAGPLTAEKYGIAEAHGKRASREREGCHHLHHRFYMWKRVPSPDWLH